MMKYVLFIFLFPTSLFLNAQSAINYWYTGHQNANMTINEPDTGDVREFGLNIINFKTNPIGINRYAKSLGTMWNPVNMWNDKGELLFYSNGSKVFNFEHKLIENADSLNYSSFWNNSFDNGYFASYLIGGYHRSLIAFQSPSDPNQYYLVSTIMNYDSLAQTQWLRFHKVVYSIIDMSLNGGKGKMILKEKSLLWGDFSHAISACRHANGKDWWIVSRGYQDTNCYYFFKLDNQGIRYDHKQCLGINFTMKYSSSSSDSLTLSYGSAFSPDGKKFSIVSSKGIELFDFNRCTGIFSNPKFSQYPYGDTDSSKYPFYPNLAAPCFSPNSQYIYTDNTVRIYQFDAQASNFSQSGVRVALWDGFLDHLNGDTTLVGAPTTFNTMQLAPNSKLYIGNGGTARYMTEIEFPDKRGVACNVRQHAYRMKTYIGGVPYYPNYNLGADTCAGSSIEQIEDIKIEIYPNPASDYVSIQFDYSPKVKDIYMTDMLGREFRPVIIEEDRHSVKYDVSDLPRGIYLVRVDDKLVKLLLE